MLDISRHPLAFKQFAAGTQLHRIHPEKSLIIMQLSGKILNVGNASKVRYVCSDMIYLLPKFAPVFGRVEEDSLRDRMQTWKDATVSFNLGNPASGFMIEDMAPRTVQGYSFDMKYVADGNGTVSVAGFGDDTGVFNTLSGISVSSQGRTVSFNVPAGFTFWQGMNRKNTVECNPLASLGFNSTDLTEAFTVQVNMTEILSSLSGWKQEFGAVFDDIIPGPDYSGSLEQFSFSIRIPACSEDNVIGYASLK